MNFSVNLKLSMNLANIKKNANNQEFRLKDNHTQDLSNT